MAADDVSSLTLPGIAGRIHLESVDSTNSYAKRIGSQLAMAYLPCLITCDQQTAGRGRGNNRWIHAEGNLAFSIVFDKGQLAATELHWIGLWTAICLQQCAASHLPNEKCQLKWPNDLIINDRKNAGILMESVPENPNRLIVGVGLNLCYLPDSERDSAGVSSDTDYFAWRESGQEFAPARVLKDFLLRWLTMDFKSASAKREVLAKFRESDWLQDRSIELLANGSTSVGKYTGLSEQGFLMLQTADQPDPVLTFASCDRVRRVD